MRKTESSVALAAALLCAMLMSSCEKQYSMEGQPVRFSVSSGIDTKASYSGETYGTPKKERIDWESGDKIRVYCAQCGDPASADYSVDAGSITSSSAVSKATASAVDVGLIWGEGEHVFYSVYPSPASTGKSADELGNGTMKGNVPASQKPLSITSSSNVFTAKADLLNQYMVSKKSVTPTGGDMEVTLPFTPITTAIEFTIENGFVSDNALKIKTITLTSDTKDISGTFTANLGGWTGTYPACTAEGSDGTKSVSMDFTGTDMESTGLAKGESLTFTFFLRPTCSVDDLTFKLVKADGSWVSTKLAYSNDSTHGNAGLEFPCHKKSYLKGLLVPEGAVWTVKYDPDVEQWNNGGSTPINPVPEVAGDPLVTSWDIGINDDLQLGVPSA